MYSYFNLLYKDGEGSLKRQVEVITGNLPGLLVLDKEMTGKFDAY